MRAAVFRQYPFTIILKKVVDRKDVQQCQLKLDPGSVTTGIAILQNNKLIWAAELTDRGQQIKHDLESRRSLRRGRRSRKTRAEPKAQVASSDASTLRVVQRLDQEVKSYQF